MTALAKRIRRLWWTSLPPHGCLCNACRAEVA